MTEFLTSHKAQTTAIWLWWILITLSAVILVFTGIEQSWDNILLRISTASGLIAAAIAKIMPKKLRDQIVLTGGTEWRNNESGDKSNERIVI